MMRWIGLGVGALAMACGGTFTTLFLTFPSKTAATWSAYQVHSADEDYAAEVGSMRPWWFPGLRAEDVTFYTVKKGRKTKDNPDPESVRSPLLTLDSFAVRMRVLPRLMGQWSFGYDAELLGGEVVGYYSRGEAGAELSFDIERLNLAKAPIHTDEATVNLLGFLSGSSDLVLNAEDVKASTGSLELSLDGFQLAEGSKVMGLTLPVVTFSTSKVRLEAKDGKLVVTEGTFDGDVLDMTLTGDISLNKKLERSRNRLELVVTLPADLDQLARIAPSLKRARDAEGAYHFNIGGTVLSPTFRAGRGSGGGGVARTDSAGSRPAGFSAEGGEEEVDAAQTGSDPEASRQDRKRRREERIKERRERLRQRREEAAGGTASTDEGPQFDRRDPADAEFDGPMRGDDEGPPPDEGPDRYPPDFGEGPPPDDMPDWGPPGNEDPPPYDE